MKKYRCKWCSTVLLLGLMLAPGRLPSQDLAGQRLKITGRWNGTVMVGERLQYRAGQKDPSTGLVSGAIDSIDAEARLLYIGPLRVQLRRETQFQSISPGGLSPGKVVRVKGRLKAERLLIAGEVRPSSSEDGYLQMIGQVKSVALLPQDRLRLDILGVTVMVSSEVYDRGISLIRRPDDKRPEKQFTTALFGRPLTIGGEIGTKTRFDGDVRLRQKKDDQLRLENGIKLEMFYRPSRRISIFVQGKSSREAILYAESGDRLTSLALQRGESWVYWAGIGGSRYSIQAGRQNFREPREWWWDKDLDAVRLYYNTARLYVEIGLARELAATSTREKSIDPEEQGVVRLLGRASLHWSRDQQFDLFYLAQGDFSSSYRRGDILKSSQEDERDSQLAWLGPRFSGEVDAGYAGNVRYWADGAAVAGTETIYDFEDAGADQIQVELQQRRKVAGWAFDTGLSWETGLPGNPTLTAGYAVASGGKRGGDLDLGFRQTGLQDNNDRYSGVDRFRYYGELFRPELSNIRILSAALGFPLLPNSSVEFLYHRYRQFSPSSQQRGIRIKTKPDGVHNQLGEEWDAVVGLEEWSHIEIEIVGSYFRAGRAFGSLAGEDAFNLTFNLDFNF